ncbi:hypothetical protein N7528_005843 [Penicillium herquei]|nr:hypothetical protein N7528_005843 [Penicillium herquei]
MSNSLQKVDHDITLDRLPVAEEASFDSHTEERNSKCLPETRVQLLEDIHHWIDEPKSKKIFWLHGMAGTGKSTIARTVAQRRHDEGDLGANFFFKRGEDDRGNLVKFVPTIARQLASRIPAFNYALKGSLDANPEIMSRSISEQFKRLVQEPLSKVQTEEITPSPLVIVIDALDECKNDGDIRLLIHLLSDICSTKSFYLRVFVTSRFEPPVRLGFHDIMDENNHQDLVLHRISPSIVELDISVFFRHEFAKIREDFNLMAADELKLTPNWPSQTELEKLTITSFPLFISAATICRFVSDWHLGGPRELLQKALETTRDVHTSRLSGFYSLVLEQQTINRSESEKSDIMESFCLVVGSIITLANPLSKRALAKLLSVNVGAVVARLNVLQSVLDVPEDLDLPIRLLHLSFRDFLVTERRGFWVDEKLTHKKLAKCCLRVMFKALKANICNLPFPGTSRSELDGRSVKRYIPPELEYACLYWVYHQTSLKHEADDYQQVDDLLKAHLLHWFEVMSLIGRSEDILNRLRDLASWLEEGNYKGLLAFVQDAVRLVRANIVVIDEAPLQVYSSVLVFAPRKSLVRQSYENKVPSWLSLWPQVKEDWDPCLSVIEWPDGAKSVAFSHDSKMVVGVPNADSTTVRIWNTDTGKCEQMLDHGDQVWQAVFSHDSKMVASASTDKMTRIWNTQTGQCVQVLKGHSNWLFSVAFSHDSKLTASGSFGRTIRIWNTRSGECEQLLVGHHGIILQLAFSWDSNTIYSVSEDDTVRIWNLGTGQCEKELEFDGDNIRTMVFSPDLTKGASVSTNNTVSVWDIQTGSRETLIEGHGSKISCLALSHDSKALATAAYDQTIRIWNTYTGNCNQILQGHSSYINSVAFSHDSRILVSGSDDGTLRIWDTQMRETEQLAEGHNNQVWSIAISPDMDKVVSASFDNTLRIWNTQTGKCEQVLEGHSRYVESLEFSHDSKMVVSACADNTARIWNTQFKEGAKVLEGHSGSVQMAIFSHDSTMVASASIDGTARIWDTQTGNCKQVLQCYGGILLFSHDSKMLVSASDDFTIRVWDVQTGKCEKLLKGHTDLVTSMVLSNDSSILVSGSYDKTIQVWNTQTGRCEQPLEGHGDGVTSVALSYDSLMVASVSYDKTAKIWNAKTGSCHGTRFVDRSSVSVDFEPYNWNDVVDDIRASSANCPTFFNPETSLPRIKDLKLGLRESTWITMAGKNLLCLPAELRENSQRIAISADTIAMGFSSGRVLILRFSEVEMAKL